MFGVGLGSCWVSGCWMWIGFGDCVLRGNCCNWCCLEICLLLVLGLSIVRRFLVGDLLR